MTHQIMAAEVRRYQGPSARSKRVGKNDVLMEALRNTPLFALATDRELRRVAAQAEKVIATSGTALMEEGERGDTFYVVLDGVVRLSRNGRTIANLGPGRSFGELSLLTAAPRNASATAVDDTELVAFSRKSFAKLIDDAPLFARRLMQGMAARLREHDAKSIQ
jgi:CRP-like cAMP-binding protein